nr:RHS domain-containing protein [Pseudomonas syringae group genomosp. 3]
MYYYHTNQIGTPLEMTDAEGQIVCIRATTPT